MIILALLLVCLVCFVIISGDDREPSYHGVPLSSWILQERGSGIYDNAQTEYVAALKEMGTNAVSILIRWAGATDGKFKSLAIRLVNHQTLIRAHIRTALEKQDIAEMGFAIMGTNAISAYDALVVLTKHTDPRIREGAIACLTLIEPEKEKLLPILRGMLGDKNENVKIAARDAIAGAYPSEAKKMGLPK